MAWPVKADVATVPLGVRLTARPIKAAPAKPDSRTTLEEQLPRDPRLALMPPAVPPLPHGAVQLSVCPPLERLVPARLGHRGIVEGHTDRVRTPRHRRHEQRAGA